jgi:hypothetical protein
VLNRRQLLAAAATGVGGIALWRIFRSSEEDAIVAVLRKRLDYLILDEKGLHDYARNLVAERIVSSNRLRLLDVAGPVYTHLFPSQRNAFTHSLRHGEERVVSLYLLSSDFFANGADETRTVRYRGFYNPLRRLHPCSNPFSRPLVG